jgi:hypothetical protein
MEKAAGRNVKPLTRPIAKQKYPGNFYQNSLAAGNRESIFDPSHLSGDGGAKTP